MSKHQIVITEIIGVGTDAETLRHTEVYKQTFDSIDLSSLVLALNKKPRTRKSRAASGKTDKA